MDPPTIRVHLNCSPGTVYRPYMIDRRLELLRAVERQGTVTAAAEVCHLTPSAASHQLKALARELGVELLEPIGRNVRLTAAAHTLLTHAQILSAQWEQARAELAEYRDAAASGPLRLCGFSSAATALVPDAAARLRDTHPHVMVQVSDAEPRQAFDRLLSRDVDIAVVVATPDIPSRADPDFELRSLLEDPLDLAVPVDHPFAARESIALSEAAEEPWIVGATGSTYYQLVMLACVDAGFAPGVAHHASEWDTGAALIAHGFGVSLAPRLAHLPLGDRIVRVPLAGPTRPARHVLAGIRAGSSRQPSIAAGLEALQAVADSKRPDGAGVRRPADRP